MKTCKPKCEALFCEEGRPSQNPPIQSVWIDPKEVGPEHFSSEEFELLLRIFSRLSEWDRRPIQRKSDDCSTTNCTKIEIENCRPI